MFQGVDTSKIIENANKLSPTQLTFYNTLKLGVAGAVGYGVWVYALPYVFTALGMIAGVGLGLGAIILAFLAREPIFKYLKGVAKGLDKAIIRKAPFEEFAKQRLEIVRDKAKFYQDAEGMVKIEQEMKSYAVQSEKDATDYQSKVGRLKDKLNLVRENLKTFTNKESDEYTHALNTADRLYAEANGLQIRYEQAQELTRKYGVRANQFSKLNRKISRMANQMDIRIMEFDNTVFLLKQDYDFSKKSSEGSSAMKKAMMFEKSWQLEYATEVVSSAITHYIADTKMNMRDIASITANYDIDDDSIFDKINTLSARIDSGEEKILSAKSYNNPDKIMTQEDNAASGGFGSIGF